MYVTKHGAGAHQASPARPLVVATVLLLVALLCPLGVDGNDAPLLGREYEVKAAFLFNFAKFVEWPEEVFDDQRQPITIGIVGPDPFGPVLDRIVRGHSSQGRPFEIHRLSWEDDLNPLQVLFLGHLEPSRMRQILSRLDGRPVLTVGESDDFNDRGGMIRFRVVRSKVRFRINLTSARQAGLKISSSLLQIAESVEGG